MNDEKSREDKVVKLLTLSRLKGIGKVTLNKLISSSQLDMDVHSLCKLVLKKAYSEQEYDQAKKFADYQMSTALRLNHKIIAPFDSEYPSNLMGLPEQAPLLFCAGNIETLNYPSIAIIGTREPTVAGEKIAHKLATWLSSEGWNIVSGLAIGVDTIAHKAATQLTRPTVAVMAHGLDTVYPKQNSELYEDIINGVGCSVTEYSYGTTVRPQFLVQRDYIQAALSLAVLLVQSDHDGGSMHASRKILNYNRPLIVAGQSSLDKQKNEPKIQANLTLLGSDDAEIQKLLKLSRVPHSLIYQLHSKNQYPDALQFLKGIRANSTSIKIETLL